jgi:hypothetical protein
VASPSSGGGRIRPAATSARRNPELSFATAINAPKQNSDIQFKRIAQVQADFDQISQVWRRTKIS